MKKFLIIAFLFAISGCQNEQNIPTSPSEQTLEKSAKVVICHKTGNGTFKALEISVNALPAHLAHGDYLPDADGDGYTAEGACTGSMNDCNDNDPNINPNATEILGDGIDNNCNGEIDEGTQINTYYADNDNDGYGDPSITVTASTQPAGYVTNGDDCDDTKSAINPNGTEVCDGVDNNCNDQIDEGFQFNTYFVDSDNDGYGDPYTTVTACSQPTGYVTNDDDCDDIRSNSNPGAAEVCGDNMDNDCDGMIDEGCSGPCQGITTVTYESKTYHTVEIGNQCWFRENLNVGTSIYNYWNNQTDNGIIEKFCYDYNEANCETYGGLYQWNEAMQYSASARGICPEGWHIPTAAEFQTLKTAVGYWSALAAYGDNTSGFSALLAGNRGTNGSFNELGNLTWFWSSTEYGTVNANFMKLGYSILFNSSDKGFGNSVRCIKD